MFFLFQKFTSFKFEDFFKQKTYNSDARFNLYRINATCCYSVELHQVGQLILTFHWTSPLKSSVLAMSTRFHATASFSSSVYSLASLHTRLLAFCTNTYTHTYTVMYIRSTRSNNSRSYLTTKTKTFSHSLFLNTHITFKPEITIY